MKKVRITLKEGSPGKKFYLFPNAESLYMFLEALEKGEQLAVAGIEELLLEKNGYIEAELRGFEYAYDSPSKYKRFDLVRLGKAEQPKNASGQLVTVHHGWVSGGLLPMKDYSDSDIEARVLRNGDHGKLDLPVLFKDEVIDESVDVELDEDDLIDDDEPDSEK